MNDLKLTHMPCARICHDLITPAHAVHTGLDMLISPEDGQDFDQILQLCHQSATSTLNRLVFFRAAFGMGVQQFHDFTALKKFIVEFLTPLNISWIQYQDIDFEHLTSTSDIPNLYRIILNIVFMGTEIASSNVNLSMHVIQDPKLFQINFRFQGKMMLLRPELHQALMGQLSEQDWTVRNVQAVLTHLLLNQDQFIPQSLNSTRESFEICIQKYVQ